MDGRWVGGNKTLLMDCSDIFPCSFFDKLLWVLGLQIVLKPGTEMINYVVTFPKKPV